MSSRIASVAGALALGGTLLVPTAASAAGTPGTLTFDKLSGTINDPLQVSTGTTGSCPVGSDGFAITITGGNLPSGADTIFVNGYAELSSAGTTAGAATGFSVSLSKTLSDIRQDAGVPALATGLYTVTLSCRAALDPTSLQDYVGKLALTTSTAFVSSAPVRVASPTIGGVARVGQTLTCAPGTWTGATGYTYQFLENGVVAQTSTTKRTLVLAAADRNKLVSCRVTARNAVGSATPVTTRALKIGLGYAPKATTRAKIVYSGTPTAGKTFTASRGVWSPKATYSYVYIWKRGTTIVKSGATATSYRTTAKDKGKVITLTVQAKRTGYTTGTSTSLGVRVR